MKLEKSEQRSFEIERAEKEKLEKEKAALDRLEYEKAEKEKAILESIERGIARKEKAEKEKSDKEKAEKEKKELERAEKEKLENEKLEKIKERREKEKAEREKDKIEREKAEREKLEKEKLENENENENEKTTVFQLPSQLRPAANDIQEEKVSVQEYSPLNSIYFMNISEMEIDFSVYSRIKKSDGFEYNKKFSSGSKISRSEIERVLLRSGKDLYIAHGEVKKASALLNGLFLERFQTPNLSWFERMKINSDSFEILLDLFKNSSFDKYNVEIIKELIKSLDIMVKAPEVMTIFLTGLKANKLSYGYTHSFLSFYLMMQIVDHFPWSKDQSKNKLLYLSLFHDLNLNSDRLIKLHHNYSQESKNLPDEEKNIMLRHAEASANVLEGIVKAPKELTALIKEHHGLKSGKGFIDTLSIAITPTSMAFIVIEGFVTQYLGALEKMEGDKAAGPTKANLELIFTELKKKYDRLTYADVLAQLQKFINSR
ncbi:MAG: hypothetical protein H7281_09995 [Bacteriovorax sp.]|nr:hypothetical protein [Bacteriovorax sp.]